MDGLDLVAKERYKQKLESVGLQVSDDPYLEANSHRFRDDMSLWPRIEYGHIFGYFIKRPGGSGKLVQDFCSSVLIF